MATSVTIRNVPDQVRDELAARALRRGQSLQEYLRTRLVEFADKPDMESLLQRIRDRKAHTGTVLESAAILAHRDADRT